ncbi:MAG: D-sedoheptulose 7-phosphate isomerase [Syntrophobacterales bacterium]|jgi:D-sedoheptulose 7-phosphate isomerase|nr:D-sedoheptulose 7-phosphate isomerase [Syntrophobacterales bacterium]
MEDFIIKIFKESCHVKELFINENLSRLVEIINTVTRCLENGHKIMIFGNGGSSSDSQHLAAEFVNRFKIERPPLPAISLAADVAVLTSIGNDYEFASLFSKQIRAIGQPGDIAWGLSTSGKSANVVKALDTAQKNGLVTIGFAGKDGGDMTRLCDHLLTVPSTNTARIQEVHITAGHVICEMVDFKLFQRPEIT